MAFVKLPGLHLLGGRFVSGDMNVKQDKTYENKPIPPEEQQYYFAVAIPKTAPGVTEVMNAIYVHAHTQYANAPAILAMIGQGWVAQAVSGFAWKIDDGDVAKIDKKTGQYKPIPAYIAGCWVFRFGSRFEFGACDELMNDIPRTELQRGCYLDVTLDCNVNGQGMTNPGVFLNPVAVRRSAHGQVISSQVAASAAFAGIAVAVPVGGMAAPVGVAVAAPVAVAPVAAPVAVAPVAAPVAVAPVAAPVAVAVPPVAATVIPAPVAAAPVGGVSAVPPAALTASPTNPPVPGYPAILTAPVAPVAPVAAPVAPVAPVAAPVAPVAPVAAPVAV